MIKRLCAQETYCLEIHTNNMVKGSNNDIKYFSQLDVLEFSYVIRRKETIRLLYVDYFHQHSDLLIHSHQGQREKNTL